MSSTLVNVKKVSLAIKSSLILVYFTYLQPHLSSHIIKIMRFWLFGFNKRLRFYWIRGCCHCHPSRGQAYKAVIVLGNDTLRNELATFDNACLPIIVSIPGYDGLGILGVWRAEHVMQFLHKYRNGRVMLLYYTAHVQPKWVLLMLWSKTCSCGCALAFLATPPPPPPHLTMVCGITFDLCDFMKLDTITARYKHSRTRHTIRRNARQHRHQQYSSGNQRTTSQMTAAAAHEQL